MQTSRAEHREGEYSPKLLGYAALVLMNDIPSDSQDTKEKSQYLLQQLGVKTAREAVKMLNNFKVDPLFPFPTISSAKPPRSGPLVLRNVGKPQAVSAGPLFTVPSHFHLLDISSCLPATPSESKEVSRQ